MVKNIKLLVEEYFNSTEQMNMLMKSYEKQKNKDDKAYEARQQFLSSILGRNTYNKYVNNGVFAPLPLSALHLTISDFSKLINSKDLELITKVINEIGKSYARNDFNIVNVSETNKVIQTNIVLKTLDNIIDFLMVVKKAVKKVCKTEEMNWSAITMKFRNYLK